MKATPMDAQYGTAESTLIDRRLPLYVAGAFLLLHALLAVLVDATDPDAFLRADRALARMRVVQELLASPSFGDVRHFLASHGVVGDYAMHALLFGGGGRFAVVLVQVVLCVFSGVCVYRLGRFLDLTPRMSALAMAVYLALPHALVFPHQLATEALHMPLFAISTWLLACGIRERRWRSLAVSALCLGLATLIRPITLLWPLVAALVVALAVRPRAALIYAVLAVLPIIAWMSFIGIQTGEFGLGKSDHSMERNLYERVARIVDTLPSERRLEARAAYLASPERELGPVDYLRFSADYPGAALQHLVLDGTAFFAKSGIERITIDYLHLRAGEDTVQDTNDGWRQQLERHGWQYTATYLWQHLGAVLLISVAGALVMAALFGLAAVGALHFLHRLWLARTPQALIGTLLVGVIAYTFMFGQVLNAMQSRHRAPAEFAVVLLAATGGCVLRTRRRRSEWRGSHDIAGTRLAGAE